mmetsp:Transcript_15276/g.38857  ORF Transcript_15276/g.38857 Transcript_15276/m.38857 type:complete len:197 (+) Transcript_15276:319-909(+)
MSKTSTIYPMRSYRFGTKAAKVETFGHSAAERFNRLKNKFDTEGPRRSVEAVIVVHEHNFPHILVLKVGSSFFKLPGGRLRPGEEDIDGLKRKLNNKLAPESETLKIDWEIGECVGCFYRPNFDGMMYPYLPPHITKPKETKKVFMVSLPESCHFAVRSNMQLQAVPLFELYGSSGYGPIISSLPNVLSKYQFVRA